jgi:hypothetical protein
VGVHDARGSNKQGEEAYFGLDWTANAWGPKWLSLSFAVSTSFSRSIVVGDCVAEEEGLEYYIEHPGHNLTAR